MTTSLALGPSLQPLPNVIDVPSLASNAPPGPAVLSLTSRQCTRGLFDSRSVAWPLETTSRHSPFGERTDQESKKTQVSASPSAAASASSNAIHRMTTPPVPSN